MKKLRFGIVGTGVIAHRFANAFKNIDFAELTSVASRTEENAEKFGDEFNIENRFSSYEDMARSDKIDVAYIAVPHSGHKDASILMMKNGKSVLCEKPIAVNKKEAEEMFRCAEENNVFLMEAMWARLVPGTLKMLKMVKDGIFGEIKAVQSQFCYNMDDEPDHHVFKNEHGGGSLLDVGVYCLNVCMWYLGKDVEKMHSFAEITNGTDTQQNTIIKYKSGSLAEISSATLVQKENCGYIYGTKGYAYLRPSYAPYKIVLHLNGKDEEILDIPYGGNGFEHQIKHVCECIGSGLKTSPVNTPENTLYIMEQMDSIRKDIGLSYPQDIFNE